MDLSGIVFPFEDVGDSLELLPLAARRALDLSGYRLSLEGYQSLPVDARLALAERGAETSVDSLAVERIIRKATHPPTRIKPIADPDPFSPPEQLETAVVDRKGLVAAWQKLRPLDRFALVHVLRRSIAHDDVGRLDAAMRVIVGDPRTSNVPSTKRSERPPPELEPEAPAPSRKPAHADVPRAPAMPEWTIEPSRARAPISTAPPPSAPAASRGLSSLPPRPEEVSTHLGAGGEVHMIDVASKAETSRRATASGSVFMRSDTALRLSRSDVPKGEVLATARVAGILAAKRTPELIPLCHHVALSHVEIHVDIEVASGTVTVTAVAEATDRTGVEMEALTAVSVACLTIYDMLKGVDRDMVIGDVKLLTKTGGKTGPYSRDSR
jgi:cyclic pyranopterin phosphate synthase